MSKLSKNANVIFSITLCIHCLTCELIFCLNIILIKFTYQTVNAESDKKINVSVSLKLSALAVAFSDVCLFVGVCVRGRYA